MGDFLAGYAVGAAIFLVVGAVFAGACHLDARNARGTAERLREEAHRRNAARVTLAAPVWPLLVAYVSFLVVRGLVRWAR